MKLNMVEAIERMTDKEKEILVEAWNHGNNKITLGMLPFCDWETLNRKVCWYIDYDDCWSDDDQEEYDTYKILTRLQFKLNHFKEYGVWPKRRRVRL